MRGQRAPLRFLEGALSDGSNTPEDLIFFYLYYAVDTAYLKALALKGMPYFIFFVDKKMVFYCSN